MNFYVSASHVKRQNRRAIYLILFLAAASAACAVSILNSNTISGMVFPLIGILVFTPPILSSYKRIKEGAAAYPVIGLDEPNGKVAVAHKDITVTVDLAQIKNLRLQHKSGRLESAIVETSSGETLRFEGYENLEALALVLERLTPKENITNASLYHR
jgi:hypothetical protein